MGMTRKEINAWNALAEQLNKAEREGNVERRERVLRDMRLFVRRIKVPTSAIPREIKR